MTERPIIFSGPMVRAILDGRKTQTRRVVKRQKHPYGHWLPPDEVALEVRGGTGAIRSPYGRPGDKLWVRETWGDCTKGADAISGTKYDSPWYRANADDYGLLGHDGIGPVYIEEIKWRPSIHMPRWASRITLEITDVRVERLQQITGADAVAEGVRSRFPDCGIAQNEFHDLWDSINARRGHDWYTNPWVWVIEFRRSGNDT